MYKIISVAVLSNGKFEMKQIRNDRNAIEEIVCGPVENVNLCDDFKNQNILTCRNGSEELSKRFKPEIAIYDDEKKEILNVIKGNCVFVNYKDSEFESLTPSQIATINYQFSKYSTDITDNDNEYKVACIVLNEQKVQKFGFVPSEYYDKFDYLDDKYFISFGEGETKATQIYTAVNKLIHEWYQNGGVFDNTYSLEGWCNDVSTHANWLYTYTTDKVKEILDRIKDCDTYEKYEYILKDLADELFKDDYLSEMNKESKIDSIYECKGKFRFEDDEEWHFGDEE